MRSTILASVVIATLGVFALPSPRDNAPVIDDVVVLNFALTLEHLENAFYKEGLAKYDEAAFKAAGLPDFARGRFLQVADHEAAHVKLLETVLGDKATKPCEYSFPHTDPKSFSALSQALEGVGVSAYAGAAKLITSKAFLTAAASILATEARHASFVAAAVLGDSGWSGAFDVPLGVNEVFTLAAPFIKSCPSTNPPLPVKAFPSLTLSPAKPGCEASITFTPADGYVPSSELFVAFFTGLGQEFAPVKDGKVVIPGDLLGTVYAVVTTNGTAVDDSNTVAGPAILEFPFDSTGKLVAQ